MFRSLLFTTAMLMPIAAFGQTPLPAAPPKTQAHALATPHTNLPACPGDKVVWVNTKSGIYHFQGERWFGATKAGKYLCEKAADSEGDRPTHNGQ